MAFQPQSDQPNSHIDVGSRAKYAHPKGGETASAAADLGATEALASFVVESTYNTLPPHLVEHLRRLVVDNIGNTSFAAGNVESSPLINAAVRALDEGAAAPR